MGKYDGGYYPSGREYVHKQTIPGPPEKLREKLIRYVHSMKKSELQEALLQLLFEGPEWQYDRFMEYNMEWNGK